ncbi:hypothetical protein SAMN02745146_3558 [Hymenobacter daecheongensis DSM 21074]|uniref:DUF1223 domain-containing protein n=1 Tax=Hymenobacter daecheongensis DSM 21074 TaxID=1121955 RepID=A0A1M6KT93_9BACT|nr:DUF1223 domain-containing protein [Hymenobacter daecheongensis]SHJ62171.1 hypothetical protein SAMN02745146_3558 [Hymenobacter daecheongensis DSM 21074]
MKRIALALTPFITVATAAVLMSARPMLMPDAPNAATPPVPVVVELFTSEGCSSCPAADAALRALENEQSLPGIEVLALGQHVDYWNRLGWKDPYASAALTQRQRDYAAGFGSGSYTPQAVVNGQYEFVGSRRQELAATIVKAAKAPRATVQLARTAAGGLTVRVADLPAGTAAAEVALALTESNLSTQVGRGENSGRLLRHAAVVRELRTLGPVAADGTFTATAPLPLAATWKVTNLRAVVLVQEKKSRHIVGVASLPLSRAALTSRN